RCNHHGRPRASGCGAGDTAGMGRIAPATADSCRIARSAWLPPAESRLAAAFFSFLPFKRNRDLGVDSMSRSAAVVKRVQYAALPYRLMGKSRTEVMLVTSLGTRRWIIPKGWPHKGRAPHHSAAREAFEEAGVEGVIDSRPVGSFPYQKRLKNGGVVDCEVEVYALRVLRQSKRWPESAGRRSRATEAGPRRWRLCAALLRLATRLYPCSAAGSNASRRRGNPCGGNRQGSPALRNASGGRQARPGSGR